MSNWSGSRPALYSARLHVGIEGLAGGLGALGGEDDLGRLDSDLPAGVSRTGLLDDWPTLHRPRRVERAAHLDVLALVVERGELPRHVVRLVVAGAGGGDQADVFGHRLQRRQQGERVERSHRVAALQGRHRHVEQRQVVDHEEGAQAQA
jgi:hypothetical protein